MGGISAPSTPLGGKLNMQLFTANGLFTPSANLIASGGFCQIWLGGGAGGGGGCDATGATINRGCGGGAGGEIITATLSILVPQAIVIGAGGAGGDGATGAAGGDGANSTFGALLTARGGSGGNGVMSVATAGKYASGGGSSGAIAATFSAAGGGGASCVENGKHALNDNLLRNLSSPVLLSPAAALTSIGGSGYYGSAANTAVVAGLGAAGIVIPGYGGVGGGGGGGYASQGVGLINGQIGAATHGGGQGGYPGTAPANGLANRSGGGGGAGANNAIVSGGAGGSGFCLIIWYQ